MIFQNLQLTVIENWKFSIKSCRGKVGHFFKIKQHILYSTFLIQNMKILFIFIIFKWSLWNGKCLSREFNFFLKWRELLKCYLYSSRVFYDSIFTKLCAQSSLIKTAWDERKFNWFVINYYMLKCSLELL